MVLPDTFDDKFRLLQMVILLNAWVCYEAC